MNSKSEGPSDLIDGSGRVQPLMSNVLIPNAVGNKQSNTTSGNMDAQQQSQIFVFSTSLANKSAESVLAGQYPNIIAYHCTQPQTKKFLETNKLYHRGSLGMNGPSHYHGMSDMMTMGGPNKCQPSTMDLMSSFGRPPKAVPSSPGDSLDGQNSQASMMPTLDFDDPIVSRNLSQRVTLYHSLTGVQVPDKNLTPQQRQHREEQQATLRKLQQVLFPKNSNNAGGPSQQQPPVTLSSSVGGPLDNCSGSNGKDDLKPSIEDDLNVDVVTTARVTRSARDLLLKPKTPTSCSFDWPKSMFGNENGKNKDGRRCGPPPSYYQTVARFTSAPIVSVPICSPNLPLAGNSTIVTNSNLSLPSHTCSALNSPAGGRPSPSMSTSVVRSLGSNGSRQESSNLSTPFHKRVPSSQKNINIIMTDSNMKSHNIVRSGDMSLNPSADAAAAVAANIQTSRHQPMKNVDPISSLAQMNQQLANNVAGGGLWCPFLPKSSLMMLQQQYQQQLQQRLMSRIPPRDRPGVLFNGGAHIQIKPSTPNTIQYLPNNSIGTPLPPQNQQQQQQSGLDFSQKFSGGPGNGRNPLSNLDEKVPSHNLQYFPNSGGGGNNISIHKEN